MSDETKLKMFYFKEEMRFPGEVRGGEGGTMTTGTAP